MKTMTSRRGFLRGISVSSLGMAAPTLGTAIPVVNPTPPAEAKITEIDEALGNYPPYDANMPGGQTTMADNARPTTGTTPIPHNHTANTTPMPHRRVGTAHQKQAPQP